MKKTALLAISLFLISGSVFAAPKILSTNPQAALENKEFETQEEARKVLDEAMQLLTTDKIADAFVLVEPYFPMPQDELSELKMQIIHQRALVKPRFGTPLGFEFLEQKSIENLLTQYIYVERYERHALRWVFTLYKPKEKWILNAIAFDDKIDQLVK